MRKVNSDSKCLFIKAKEEKQTKRKKKCHLMTADNWPIIRVGKRLEDHNAVNAHGAVRI